MYRGQWHPGTHPPLVDRATFDRVQTLIGQKTYGNHESVYGSALVKCAHCGRPLVCEIKTKQTKDGEREYRYYRCSRYTAKDHPRQRANEAELDQAVLSVFERLKVEDPKIRVWIENVIRAKTREEVTGNTQQLSEIQKKIAQVNQSRSNLLTLRVHNEIDADLYAAKDGEYRDELGRLTLRLEGQGRQKSEIGELAIKVFELSQSLKTKWVASDIMEKRRILEIVGLNYGYDGISLCITMRKPFDVLVEGLKTKIGTGGWN